MIISKTMKILFRSLVLALIFIGSGTHSQDYYDFIIDPQEEGMETGILVDIPDFGRVQSGVMRTERTGEFFFKFLDLNYAKSPTGERRFQPPEELTRWPETVDGSVDKLACPSFTDLEEMSRYEHENDLEDCLTLSIYTKNVTTRYPVMVYIHGDFFFDGSSIEGDPGYLLEKKIVLVAIQYRLAPIGFLSTLSESIPGNVAVLDVIAGLKWVQKYIQYFGGDADRITVFGQGSGAAMAHLLTISPAVPYGLFHNVILQSGSVYSPYFTTSDPIKHARDIAKWGHCQTTTVPTINNCLRRLNTTALLRAFQLHGQENEILGVGNFGGFQFTIGDPLGILPEHPVNLQREANIRRYPMIGGVPRNVGSFILTKIIQRHPEISRSNIVDTQAVIDIVLKNTIGEDKFGIMKALAVEDLFTEHQMRNSTLQELAAGLTDLCSNVLYKSPVLQALQMNAKHLPRDTYLYSFDYKGQYNRYTFDGHLPIASGVSYTDENIYLFPFPDYVTKLTADEVKISEIMVDLWTSFATTSKPESRWLRDQWRPMDQVTGPYYRIHDDSTHGDDFSTEFSASIIDLQQKITPLSHFPYF